MKILLVRTSAMGDIVHSLPVLTALKRQLPEARVAWVVEAVWSRVLAGHPDIEELITVRTKAWRRRGSLRSKRSEIAAAVGAMRAFEADVAIDLMGNFKGAILARLSRAKRILGPDAADRREGSSALLLPETVRAGGVHAVDRNLAMIAALGLIPGRADFGGERLLNAPPPEAEDLTASLDRPLVLILTGAGWANKTYPMDWWAEVASALESRGYAVWIPTAPGEEAQAAEVCEKSGGAARAVDATDFQLFAALTRKARLVLGGDTGPLHLAHALGTPVLCLIGPTEPARNGPYGSPEQVLFHRLPCSGCYKRFDGPRACLLSIPPEQVIERSLESLRTG
ncbi:MAG: lipopolysaccharide heptosyltransferase I [Acidobacteriota bacterium]